MAFTIENISSVQILSDLALSPNGSKVIYRTASLKTGECAAVHTVGLNEFTIQGFTRQRRYGILQTRQRLIAQGS